MRAMMAKVWQWELTQGMMILSEMRDGTSAPPHQGPSTPAQMQLHFLLRCLVFECLICRRHLLSLFEEGLYTNVVNCLIEALLFNSAHPKFLTDTRQPVAATCNKAQT